MDPTVRQRAGLCSSG
uniref:Uncharacterized protein n=1 Tax=Nymphaea colorata TaxID=210225 RepID=A0A5K0VZL1_9MAGN